ncbi:hypothetical protein LSH36_135g05028 [Paralvinella palmiformis]|uniref:Uncharacterized protein n=1 Tax=Paralvinella palmiformis TaxID=53620 RepID=A0AAD9JVT6_9ANNE|nr:hypothetical protein LSH36_135g05028 [Paralvinella palmiformis]
MSDTSSLAPSLNVIGSLEPSQKTPNLADVDLKPLTSDLKSSPPKLSSCPLPPPLPPDPPFGTKKRPVMIQVDGVNVPLREHVDRMRRKAATKSGVTEEARKVLEQFLKHSYGRGLTSPYTSEQNTQSEREYVDECPYMLLQSNESYYGRGNSSQAAGLTTKEKEGYFDEPDYAEPAEPEQDEDEEDDDEEEDFEQIPETQEDIDAALGHIGVAKANSVSSQSSFGMSLRSHPASRSRSPSDRFFCSIHPPQIRGKIKAKSKKHKGLYDESSSSTEDYEYTEGYLVRRKKKSFFKWASERLRQSFRRSHNKVPGLLQGEGDSSKSSALITLPLPEEFDEAVKEKKIKGSKLKFSLKRNGSDKGSKSTQSSSTPNENNGETLQVTQDLVTASESELASYCIQEDPSAALERPSSTERRRKSPVPWKRCEINPKKKSVPPSETSKDKGIFDSFLRHIRKGSSKLKRKASKDDSVRQRSCSADNLVLRPLSKEHEKLLQRYTRHKEPEYDSDNATTHSFHEEAIRRVVPSTPKLGVVWYPPPPPPPPLPPVGIEQSDDGELQCLQRGPDGNWYPAPTPVLPPGIDHSDDGEPRPLQRLEGGLGQKECDGFVALPQTRSSTNGQTTRVLTERQRPAPTTLDLYKPMVDKTLEESSAGVKIRTATS